MERERDGGGDQTGKVPERTEERESLMEERESKGLG
jgi:hypothetical protein